MSIEFPSGWSSALNFVVDGIVTVLKRTQRWRYDGKTLKLLNRNWCKEVNRHVRSIHPRQGTQFTPDDALSLLKFCHLTSLDITPFWDKIGINNEEERSDYFMAILLQLPRLTELTMDAQFLSNAKQCDIDELKLKAAHLNAWGVLPKTLSKLTGQPLESLSVNRADMKYLGQFLKIVPSIKRLSVALDRHTLDHAHVLNGVDELEVHYEGEPQTGFFPLTSVVSLDIKNWLVKDLTPFSRLTKLKKLEITATGRDLFNEALWTVMRRLMRLSLRMRRKRMLPPRFWGAATSLKELHLDRFGIDSRDLARCDLGDLVRLEFENCTFFYDAYPPCALPSLTTLHLINCRTSPGEFAAKLFDPILIGKLTDLVVVFHKRTDITESFLDRICRMTSLESLELIMRRTSTSIPFPCDRFESLTLLPNLSRLVIGGKATEEVNQLFVNMEFVKSIGEVLVSFAV